MAPLTPGRIKYASLACGMLFVFIHENASAVSGSASDPRSPLAVLRAVPGTARQPRYDRAIRVRLRVERVRREGRYVVRLSGIGREWRVGRPGYRERSGPARFRMAYDRRTLSILAAPPARVLLKLNRYDLVAGCELDARLYGRGRLRSLPAGAYGRYLSGRGVVAQLQLSQRHHVRAIDCSGATPGGRLHAALRTLLREGAGLDYRDPRYGVVLGLLLGNSGFLQGELKERSRRLGVAHLFAASGLHLGIFYVCLYWPLARVFGRRDPRALCLPLAPCLLYLIALDVPVSLLRAFCFLSSHALQSLCHRHVPVRELLVNTALLVLLIAPGEFFRIGTALSFGAVGGILYCARALSGALFVSGRYKKLRSHASVSLAAGVCTVPLIVVFFEQHPALSLPANLILVPFVGLLLPCIAGVCALAWFAGRWGDLFSIGDGVLSGAFALSSSANVALHASATGAAAGPLDDWLWPPLLAGLRVFLILTEILAYVDGSLTPRIVADTGGLLFYGVRILPLAADALLLLGIFALRYRASRGGHAGDADSCEVRRRMVVCRLMIWTGIVLLGPPGVWLEAAILRWST